MSITAERYGQLRRLHDAVTQRLYQSMSQRAIDATAQRMELKSQLENDYQRAIVLESVLCDEVVGGKTAVGRMAVRPDLGDEERALLVAMRDARTTVFQVVERATPFGVQVLDVLGGDTFVLADTALTEMADPGELGAARLMRFPDFAMTTGVPLQIPPFALSLLARAGVLPASAWEPKSRARIATQIYRLALCTEEQLQPFLAAMALSGTDALSLAMGRTLKAPK